MEYITQSPGYWYMYYLYGKCRGIIHQYINNDDIFEANEILDGIYISNIWTTYNKDEMKKRGITHIVNAILGVDPPYPEDFNYLKLEVIDMKDEKLGDYFDDTYKFIDNAMNNNGKVLIHCICGISRSVTILCAYMIKKYGYSPNKALKIIKEKRNIANPNPSFRKQLEEYYIDNIKHQYKDL